MALQMEFKDYFLVNAQDGSFLGTVFIRIPGYQLSHNSHI